MLKHLLGFSAAGVYSAGIRFSEAAYVLAVVVGNAFYPSILRLRSIDGAGYLAKFQRLYDIVTALSLGVIIGMLILAPWLISILLGPEYSASAGVLRLHSLTIILAGFSSISGRWLISEGMQMEILKRAVVGALLSAVFNFLFIPRWGVEGAALSSVLTFLYVGLGGNLINRKCRILISMQLSALNPLGLHKRLVNLK